MSERDNKRGNSDRRRPGGKPESDRSENRKSDDKRRPGSRPYSDRNEDRNERRPDSRKRTSENEEGENKTSDRSNARKYSTGKPFGERTTDRNTRRPDSRKRYPDTNEDEKKPGGRPNARKYSTDKPFDDRSGDKNTQWPDSRKRTPESDEQGSKPGGRPSVRKYAASKPFGYRGKRAVADVTKDGTMRLNKYISNSGICSRREADDLIKTGLVEVNGKSITEMGYKVQPNDIVKYAGEKITPEKPVYFLLNKPKDYTAEMKSTMDRRNGLTLLRGIGNHSVLPVGKMDRSTSGLIIYTNDGDLTMKLCNPKLGVKKLFHVHLDKNLKKEHMDKLLEGVELEDGFVKAEEISYVGDKNDKKQIGIETKSGKNKAVRLMLESLGYYVVKLDRVMFAGLTKKDLPRGRWRALTTQEVINLKMLK
ncbi:rRNA pseudouridine synthase [Cryomorpha ignava]|uniref:rRNA pseudouridine synthase n=1 Tax=Cryomorpha ignava TaxID=101383 RepID=A0A7K3WS97_9FLAO|nr:pseudouridine synthase [Cryomorpha ignava]NEN24560.1 rRNA pseudouridine synthase [Cryomorpha ignava]